MQVRQRPKALVGSSSSLVRMGFAGSNSSLSRPGHVGGRVDDASVSPVSPLSETTSVISDSDRPLFNLDERYSLWTKVYIVFWLILKSIWLLLVELLKNLFDVKQVFQTFQPANLILF